MQNNINIDAAIQFQQARLAKKQDAAKARFEKASQDFETICNMIISKYKPKKIIQWGSLLNEKKFSQISDIDIAIAGINNAAEYFQLIADAEKLTNIPLDIVLLEDIHPLHRKMIEQKGKLIYSRDES